MTTSAATTRQIQVFLVDDHPLFLDALGHLLSTDRHISVVGQAQTAEEALERIAACAVDVVVMDINLPGMDGLEATRILKQREPSPRVVVLTSFGDRFLTRSIEAGADGYLLKTAGALGLVQGVLQAAGGAWPIDPSLTRSLLSRVVQGKDSAAHPTLSERHRELLRLIADGLPSKAIADRLRISPATLKRDVRAIFDQLGVNDRAHAVAEAYKRGLLEAPFPTG